MPEGDTLHRTAARLAPYLENRVVRSLELPRRAQRIAAVVGHRVSKVEARGKNLLVHFDCGIVLHTHLKMNGVWRAFAESEKRPAISGNVVVLLEVEGAVAMCFHAPIVRLLRASDVDRDPRIAELGPDPMSASFDASEALRRLRILDSVPIAEAVLDQRVVAGIGNVWKSELLFEHGFDPSSPVARFTDDELRAFLASTEKGMRRGVITGTRPQRVYGRAKKPCHRCGGAIEITRHGEMNRSTYFCPRCQPTRAEHVR